MDPFEVEVLADINDLAQLDVVAIDNGVLTRVHPTSSCAGETCWIHNSTPGHMVGWPVRWRGDKGTAERVCQHNIGHPDPDDIKFHARHGRDTSIHGCDGCCSVTTSKGARGKGA